MNMRSDTLERNTRICVDRTVCSGRTGPERPHSTWARLACRQGPGHCRRSATRLATKTQPFDERAVTLDVDLRDVLDQPAPASHQQQQTPPRVVVVLVHLEVLGEVGDPLGQQRDLRLRRSGVGVVQGRIGQEFLFSARL